MAFLNNYRNIHLKRFRQSCWPVLIVMSLILLWGGFLQWSVSPDLKMPTGHLIRVGSCLFFLFFSFLLSSVKWRRSAYLIYFVCLSLLIVVLFYGRETNNSRRWIDLFSGFKIQPSELMKMALILCLARWFADRPKPKLYRDIFFPAFFCVLPSFLVLVAPDLGTSLTYFPVFFAMIFLAEFPSRKIGLIFLVPVLLSPIGWVFIQDYQKDRVETWWHQNDLSPEEISSEGYHLWHSKMAIGTGGWDGHGWSEGPENRLQRLPERHNDFVFPVIAEELGFKGAAVFLFIYTLFGLLFLFYAYRYRCRFTRLVLIGIGVHFLSHMVLNVGVTLGIWPTTGLSLPMVSYGGSSLMVSGVAVGVALSVTANRSLMLTDS